MNSQRQYLYRDAANDKRFGEAVFGGPPDEGLVRRLRGSLFDREWLVPMQVSPGFGGQ